MHIANVRNSDRIDKAVLYYVLPSLQKKLIMATKTSIKNTTKCVKIWTKFDIHQDSFDSECGMPLLIVLIISESNGFCRKSGIQMDP